MVRVFLYEFITGGGLLTAGEGPPAGSLLQEGAAMLAALAEDFSRISGVTVDVLHDARLPEFDLPRRRVWRVSQPQDELRLFKRLSAEADVTVLIAPETNGLLTRRVQLAEAAHARLLSPGSTLVELASDKNRTAAYLAVRGIPVPRGEVLQPGAPLPIDCPTPFVCKPARGAGSEGVALLQSRDNWRPAEPPTHQRIEAYCPGIPVSCAWIGGAHVQILEPCLQYLSDDGRFTYQGGRLPLEAGLRRRARALARRVAEALPPASSYIGVDMVLGRASDNNTHHDVVIEVNPRLTTSYVGLRAACRGNLAEAMLHARAGKSMDLDFSPGCWEFDASGNVSQLQDDR